MPGMTGLFADPGLTRHETGPGHPERPSRYDAVMRALAEGGLLEEVDQRPVHPAEQAELERCHSAAYLNRAQHEIEAGAHELSTGDTKVCRESWEVALMAAGAGIAAVRAVLDGTLRNAFCVVRPPGHHATPDGGMGFCILNNIAVAAREARERLDRVAIVDWDVHHGNGTQDIFYDDPSVLFVSTHQWPLYPGTGAAGERGAGAGLGSTFNFPVPAGSGIEVIGDIFREDIRPMLLKFRPEMMLISAGFDARVGDPLGDLRLTDADFAELTRMLCAIADEICEGRVVSMLEGGYALDGLGRAAAAHLRALIEAGCI